MKQIKLLKFKDWIRLKKPQYDGLLRNLEKLKQEGLSFGCLDLIKLAEQYNCPIPKFSNGKMILNVKKDSQSIDIDFNIAGGGLDMSNFSIHSFPWN